VGDLRPAPAPRYLTDPAPARRRRQWLAPLAAAVAVLGLVGGVLAVVGAWTSSTPPVAGGHSGTVSSSGAPTATATATTDRAARTVHIKLFNADHAQYGVAMPVIAIFSHKITNARPFVRATKVTADGKPLRTAWYFEKSAAGLGAMEAHLRPQDYWPAHANIHLSLDTEGKAAGKGLTYDDSLTLDFTTGARTIATVDDRAKTMSVTTDGHAIGKYAVSLGTAKSPTMSGTKVIMAKPGKVRLKGPGYDVVVNDAQQLTYSGEYLYGAPWAGSAIKSHTDTSQGCTQLAPGDAARLYDLMQVGDVVRYLDTGGPQVPATDGFGDWNVPWPLWLKGGLLPTS
jgi:lipoprotein-anchoring transpeptidase ErfK/SrfK